jgi:hypothetical protein
MKNNISVSFCEEPTVTDEKFLAVTEDTALSHVPAGTVFHLDGAIHSSTRESTHALMNLSTWYNFCPQKTYHRSLFLLGTILRFHCLDHHFVAVLTLTARSTGLPC